MFKKLYPDSRPIPKFHYIIHYPSQIECFGPLVQSWTMRQESKLSFVKRVSKCGNYKNVPQTVAKKHQLWQWYKIGSGTVIISTGITFIRLLLFVHLSLIMSPQLPSCLYQELCVAVLYLNHILVNLILVKIELFLLYLLSNSMMTMSNCTCYIALHFSFMTVVLKILFAMHKCNVKYNQAYKL